MFRVLFVVYHHGTSQKCSFIIMLITNVKRGRRQMTNPHAVVSNYFNLQHPRQKQNKFQFRKIHFLQPQKYFLNADDGEIPPGINKFSNHDSAGAIGNLIKRELTTFSSSTWSAKTSIASFIDLTFLCLPTFPLRLRLFTLSHP